jgi:hypothetical protein
VNVRIAVRRILVGAALILCLGVVVAGSSLTAQTLDALVFDADTDAGTLESLKNGMTVKVGAEIGDLEFLQQCEGDNPINLALGVNSVTFTFDYANGYSFTASGHIMVTSHIDVPVENPHPFKGLSFLAHLRVDGTNQHRGKDWPRVGDDVIGAVELIVGSDPPLGEGVYRIVRPPAN